MAGAANLRAWLQYLRIEKYFDLLSRLGHDAGSLAQLSDAELADLGLPLGPRKKILLNAGLILQSCRGAVGHDGQDPDGGSQHEEPTRGAPAMPGKGAAGARAAKPAGAPVLRPNSPAPGHWQQRVSQSGQAPDNRPCAQQQPNELPKGRHDPLPSVNPASEVPAHAVGPPLRLHGYQHDSHPQPRPQQPDRSLADNASVERRHAQHVHHGREQLPHPYHKLEQNQQHCLRPKQQPGGNPSAGWQSAEGTVRLDRENRLTALLPSSTEMLKPVAKDFPAAPAAPAASSLPAARAHDGPSAAGSPKPTTTAPCSGETATCITAAATAERRALFQLYPAERPHSGQGSALQQQVSAGGLAPGRRAWSPQGYDGSCGQTVPGSGSVAGQAGALTGCGRRAVLKRSRSWDGGSAGAGGRPCPSAGSRPSPPAAGVLNGALARGSASSGGVQIQRGCWADGQGLYAAAASASPVDCSFKSLRSAAVAAAAVAAPDNALAAAAAANVSRQSHASAPLRNGAVGATSAGGAAAGGNREDSRQGAGARRNESEGRVGSGAAHTDRHHSVDLKATQPYPGGGGRVFGGRSASAPHEQGATDQSDPQPAVLTAAGGCTSLLDDPRNYGTPELLAQLLYDDPDSVVGLDDEGDGQQGENRGALADAGDVAAVVPNSGDRNVGEGGNQQKGVKGEGGPHVTREQRLARLRALREELAATERLLETLRRLVAEEEAALAGRHAAGPGGAVRSSGARAPGEAVAAVRPPPRSQQPTSCPLRDQNPPGDTLQQGQQSAPAQRQQPQTQAQVWVRAPGQARELWSGGEAGMDGQHAGWTKVGEESGGHGLACLAQAGYSQPHGTMHQLVRSREASPDMDELPTQRWDSGMMLAERLELLE